MTGAVQEGKKGQAPAEHKLCPYCAEEIRAAAVVCKHCGRKLAPANRVRLLVAGLIALLALTAGAVAIAMLRSSAPQPQTTQAVPSGATSKPPTGEAPAASASAPPEESAYQVCDRKWGDDNEGKVGCYKEQEAAVKRMTEPYGRRPQDVGVDLESYRRILKECRVRWHNDYVMRDACEVAEFGVYRRARNGS